MTYMATPDVMRRPPSPSPATCIADICTGLQHIHLQPSLALPHFSSPPRINYKVPAPSLPVVIFDPLTPAQAKSIVRRGSLLTAKCGFSGAKP